MTPETTPVLERLGAAQLQAVATAYRDALRAHQEALNRLNVYPVPDGDTGTNMALTMESVVAELARRAADSGEGGMTVEDVSAAIGHGALMGARGNSGVILSQILRRLAEGLAVAGGAGGPEVAGALRSASEGAYEAVMRPVEGTILTVARAASDGALGAAASGEGLAAVLEASRSAAAYSLERTPELLPVLKQAGVIDAGGAGYLLLLDVLLNLATGRPVPDPPEAPEHLTSATAEPHRPPKPGHEGPRYEVMFLLEADDSAVEGFKQAWAPIGDSIAIVGAGGLWNCHIHADDIGAAVEAALDFGRPRNIRVTDLVEQVGEESVVDPSVVATSVAPPPAPAAEPVEAPRCSVVAVAAGEGVHQIFRSLGAAGVVSGGQSTNPSTGELLEAVEAAAGAEVVVLPNNKNVIPVAEQVGAMTAKTVRAVHTTSVAEGLVAMLAYDPQESAAGNAQAMLTAAGRVAAGEVTRAVRPAATDVGPVEAGDFLGITRTGIEAVDRTLTGAATRLLERLLTPEHELLTVIVGEGATDEDTTAITEWLGRVRPAVAVEVHQGGQPLYPYLFSAE